MPGANIFLDRVSLAKEKKKFILKKKAKSKSFSWLVNTRIMWTETISCWDGSQRLGNVNKSSPKVENVTGLQYEVLRPISERYYGNIPTGSEGLAPDSSLGDSAVGQTEMLSANRLWLPADGSAAVRRLCVCLLSTTAGSCLQLVGTALSAALSAPLLSWQCPSAEKYGHSLG